MPIYIEVIDETKGIFSGAIAQGDCNYYDTTKQIVMKGKFKSNKLIGRDNILIEYTDTSFKYYHGVFLNNKPNGNMIVYDFVGNGDLLRDIISDITVKKYNSIYENGSLIEIISEQDVTIRTKIMHKLIKPIEFMICFNVTEV